jgi:hypothetical protein
MSMNLRTVIRMRGTAAAVMAAVLLALAGCDSAGGDQTGASSPSDTSEVEANEGGPVVVNGTVGDTIEFTTDEGMPADAMSGKVTLHTATRETATDPDEWDPQPADPAGFLVLDLEVAATAGVVPVSDLQWSLWDGLSVQHVPANGINVVGSPFPSTALNPGRAARGVLVFNVPPGSYLLDFESSLSSRPVATFAIQA